MRDFFQEWKNALLRAWEKMMQFDLPQKVRSQAAKGRYHEVAGAVLLGWLLGIAAMLAGGIFALVFNRFAGALIFAAAAWLLMFFHDRARGDGVIAAKISGALRSETLPLGIIIPVFMMILKFVLLGGVFFYGSKLVCTTVIAGGFALETLLLADAGFSPPVFEVSEAAMRRFWAVTIVVLIIAFIGSAPAAALTILGFALLLKFAKERLNEHGLTADDIRCYGAVMIWVSLISGILTF